MPVSVNAAAPAPATGGSGMSLDGKARGELASGVKTVGVGGSAMSAEDNSKGMGITK